jgi:propanol-preferring alcohol dehydrogenase
MRAVQLTAPGQLEINTIPDAAPGPGQALVRVAGAGVCGSDLHILGAAHPRFPLPMTLGHEIAGHIVALGADVQGWEDGQAVVVYLCWGCGTCRSCVEGRDNACERFRATPPGPGLGYPGGMAEYVAVPARSLVPLGELDPIAAAPLADAGLTSFHAIGLVRQHLYADATAVVIGIGGLGHMALQILRATTACRIIAVDVDPDRLAAARCYGADLTVRSDGEAVTRLREVTAGRGAEAVFDFVGVGPTLRLAAEVVASYGALVVVGLGTGVLPWAASAPPAGLAWGTSVTKPYAGTHRELMQVVALAATDRLKATVKRYPLEQAAEVFAALRRGEVHGRAVLVP